MECFIARDLSDILNAESAKAAETKLANRASAMLIEKKTEFFEEKNAVARAYWDKYIATESDKDHGLLKHFLGGCFPDPLYIQSEFDNAIKEKDPTKGFSRFFSIFNSLSIDQIKQINAGEDLKALSLEL